MNNEQLEDYYFEMSDYEQFDKTFDQFDQEVNLADYDQYNGIN